MTTSTWDAEGWSGRVRVHAYLMMAAWGFFLPVGLITQSHLRNRPSWKQRKFGNHCHMSFMTIGFLLALVGFLYGLRHLTTFSRNPQYVTSYAMAHAILGTIVTILMVAGVLLVGLVRTVKSREEQDRYDDWPLWRKIGHLAHRSLGFVTLLLAMNTLEMGTHISSVRGEGLDPKLATKDQEYSICLLLTYFITTGTVFGSIQLAKRKFPESMEDGPFGGIRNAHAGEASESSPLLLPA